MSDYLLSKISLGTIVSFRYMGGKTGAFNLPRDIIVLAPNYEGHLHGIKLSGLTVAEQEFLQSVFRVMYGSHENIYGSLQGFVNSSKETLEQLNKERNELLLKNKAVVMRPAEQPEMGAQSGPFPTFKTVQDRFKRVIGSVIGKVSTFGRSQITGQPRGATDPLIAQQIDKNNRAIAQTQKILDYYMSLLEKNKQVFENVPVLPKDPYVFYHNFFKSFIGNNRRMKNIYRKFDVSKIQTIRVIKSVGATPGVGRR